MPDALLLFRQTLRDLRGQGGRFAFFAVCLAIGVGSTAAISGLGSSVDRSIRLESRQLLAADIEVSSNRELPKSAASALQGTIAEFGLAHAEALELVTIVAAAPDAGAPAPQPDRSSQVPRSQLVELKAVSEGYPFYGSLETDPSKPLPELLASHGAVVAPELLSHLGLTIGDRLRIGGQSFLITARLLNEPDNLVSAFSLGPRVLISATALQDTGLLAFGSRVEHRQLLALPRGAASNDLERIVASLRAGMNEDFVRIQTYAEAQPALRRGLRRLTGFLGLVALLSLVVAGVGVAQSVDAWIRSRIDELAVMRCLGVRPRELFVLGLLQTLLLSSGGVVLGIAAGASALFLVPSLLPDPNLAAFVDPVQPAAMARAALLGFGVALLFSLPSVAQTLRVPPSLVFRREAEPLRGSRLVPTVSALAGALGLTGAAALQTGSADLTWRFSLAVLGTAGVLLGAASGLVGVLRRVPRERIPARAWMRHGFAAGARPGAGTLGSIAALGLGLLVLSSMTLLTHNIRAQLDSELPNDAPSAFFIDVQSDQWLRLEALLESQGASHVVSVPVVTARLAAIDEKPVEELLETRRRGDRWALRREQRLTYLERLPADNQLVEGRLWSDPQHAEVSLERDFADELGVGLGAELTFDIQGVERSFRVTSIRTVDWESFGLNFFLVMEPGTLEHAPQTRLATARLPIDREQQIQDRVAAAMPNVTMLRLRPLLDRLTSILGRVATAVTFLGSLTVVAALLILVGALLVEGPRRSQEVALLRALGMTRGGVLAAFFVEYSLVGLVASLIGCIGGLSASYFIARHALEIDWLPQPLLVCSLGLGGMLLTAVGGLLANLRPLNQAPIAVLRYED